MLFNPHWWWPLFCLIQYWKWHKIIRTVLIEFFWRPFGFYSCAVAVYIYIYVCVYEVISSNYCSGSFTDEVINILVQWALHGWHCGCGDWPSLLEPIRVQETISTNWLPFPDRSWDWGGYGCRSTAVDDGIFLPPKSVLRDLLTGQLIILKHKNKQKRTNTERTNPTEWGMSCPRGVSCFIFWRLSLYILSCVLHGSWCNARLTVKVKELPCLGFPSQCVQNNRCHVLSLSLPLSHVLFLQ